MTVEAQPGTAPKVTQEHIESIIAEKHFYTAAEGIRAANPDAVIHPSLELLTICVLVLKNGFTVTGESACVSPENFNAATGQKWAYEKAIDDIWKLEGYALKQKLYSEKQQ